jgi:uncharacterized protein (TIGR03643 family)
MTNSCAPFSVNQIIAEAWADEISFDQIKRETGLAESDVIAVMRSNLKPRSFKLWRERVSGRKAKHGRKKMLESIGIDRDVDDSDQ